MAGLNPIDLARIIVMLEIDLAAMMGYTGAVYRNFFGSGMGMLVAALIMLLWAVLPGWGAMRAFQRKDL